MYWLLATFEQSALIQVQAGTSLTKMRKYSERCRLSMYMNVDYKFLLVISTYVTCSQVIPWFAQYECRLQSLASEISFRHDGKCNAIPRVFGYWAWRYYRTRPVLYWYGLSEIDCTVFTKKKIQCIMFILFWYWKLWKDGQANNTSLSLRPMNKNA